MKGLALAALAFVLAGQEGAPKPGQTAALPVPPAGQAVPPMAPNPFQPVPEDALRDAREIRVRNVRKLTASGSNAEAYWSFEGTRIIFQSTRDGQACDQQYVMNADGSEQRLVSTGKGRTTCGYFLPGGQRILYASTHGDAPGCPPAPAFTPGTYRWPVFPGYDLYLAKADGSDPKPFLSAPGYDAEATVSPDGKWIVFTSERGGDIDLWKVRIDGKGLQRLTTETGYDGGAFFSRDSKQLVWRTNYPKGAEAVAKYRDLLKQHLVEPMEMDIWVMDADGSRKRQLTHLKGAAFAPVFTPDDKAIVFASNHHDREGKGRTFDLWRINLDGSGLERLTWTGTFNSFAHFSPDGKRLLWVSGREAAAPRQFNVFTADWLP